MTQKTFISRIKRVHEYDVRSVMRTLDRPVGSRPQQRLKDLSKWFHSLTRRDQARVEQVVQLAVYHSIFDVLAVLDGVRMKGDRDKGTLGLVYRCGRKRRLLTGSRQEMLITLYRLQVYDQVFGS